MRSQFAYVRPPSLVDALAFLAEHGTQTSLIAGGTDLMISIRSGDMKSAHVMDVSRLEELRSVALTEDSLFIGAAVTYRELMADPLVAKHAPVVAMAARHVGSLQIRNVGTLGGNVAHASPAADSVPTLIAHDCRVMIQSASGNRVEPLTDVITGAYATNLKPDELIMGFLLQPLPGARSSFHRIARRRALSIARINAAAVAYVDDSGTARDVRLSVGSVIPRPCRMADAENHLNGIAPDPRTIEEAAHIVSREMIRQSGVRPSTEYKQPAVEGLVQKVLSQVLLSHE
jgi:CO/xanthine dehydrogenase FAD-binding subunit